MGFSRSAAVLALIPALFLFGCSSLKIVKDGRNSGFGVSYAAIECAVPAKGRPFAANLPKLKNCPADQPVRQKVFAVNDEDGEDKTDSLRKLVIKGLKTGFKLYNWLPLAGGQ